MECNFQFSDLNSLPHLMRKIGDDNSLHCFVVDALITHLLAAKQMQQLQLLLNGLAVIFFL